MKVDSAKTSVLFLLTALKLIHPIAELEVVLVEDLACDLKRCLLSNDYVSNKNERLKREESFDEEGDSILQDLASLSTAAMLSEKLLKLIVNLKEREMSRIIDLESHCYLGVVDLYSVILRDSMAIEEAYQYGICNTTQCIELCALLHDKTKAYERQTAIYNWEVVLKAETLAFLSGPGLQLTKAAKAKESTKAVAGGGEKPSSESNSLSSNFVSNVKDYVKNEKQCIEMLHSDIDLLEYGLNSNKMKELKISISGEQKNKVNNTSPVKKDSASKVTSSNTVNNKISTTDVNLTLDMLISERGALKAKKEFKLGQIAKLQEVNMTAQCKLLHTIAT